MHMYLGHDDGYWVWIEGPHMICSFVDFPNSKLLYFVCFHFKNHTFAFAPPHTQKPPHLFSHASMCSHLRSHLLLSLFWASYYLYRALGRTPVSPIFLLDLIARINPLLPFFFFLFGPLIEFFCMKLTLRLNLPAISHFLRDSNQKEIHSPLFLSCFFFFFFLVKNWDETMNLSKWDHRFVTHNRLILEPKSSLICGTHLMVTWLELVRNFESKIQFASFKTQGFYFIPRRLACHCIYKPL